MTSKPKPKREPDRILVPGRAEYDRCDNKVISSRYNVISFFPKAVLEQFRRFANQYFLAVGLIMFVGRYTDLYESAISPWTTLGPLAIVISISLLVEGVSDYKRHKNDAEMNSAICVVIRRADEVEAEGGERDEKICGGRDVQVNINKAFYMGTGTSVRGARSRTMTDPSDPHADNVNICFSKVKRKDIRQGQFVFVKNREMVPADMLLLASSNDQGGAYIETSSIDGETNLKLRNSPHIPKKILKALQDGTPMESIRENERDAATDSTRLEPVFESLDAATKRVTRFSALGRPGAASALHHPSCAPTTANQEEDDEVHVSFWDRLKDLCGRKKAMVHKPRPQDEGKYVAALTTEPPNASVHTFSGKLTLPPFDDHKKEESACCEIPLGEENVLLRGAVLRNTEWAIGLAFFTGKDTKLVMNSVATPSKFSQMDRLMNKTVLFVLLVMVLCICVLSGAAVYANNRKFDTLFYAGFNTETDDPWPYFVDVPLLAEEKVDWVSETYNFVQFFFLFVTLVSNLIPLSLYVTVEVVQLALLWLIYQDVEMYDDTTNTRALARSTIVSDLGRIQYIFSDKTGTLTQNVMRFKRCSLDGMAFGAPIERQRPGSAVKEEEEEERSAFHPLRQLLVGRVDRRPVVGQEESGGSTFVPEPNQNGHLTFHAEMFLRIMSLCHTVVVEQDIENKKQISSGVSIGSQSSNKSLKNFTKGLFGGNGSTRNRTSTTDSAGLSSQLASLGEEVELDSWHDSGTTPVGSARARTTSYASLAPGEDKTTAKNYDGAPYGYAYQAESPDEGALVSAASNLYGFQLIGRDTSGIRLRCPLRSHLRDARVVQGLKSNTLSLERLSAESTIDLEPAASEQPAADTPNSNSTDAINSAEQLEETWAILAVNKFDSDRKRMSILLRSPQDLGSLPVLFCKGADSAMLDPKVCGGGHAVLDPEVGLGDSLVVMPEGADEDASDTERTEHSANEEVNYALAHILGINIHLGEFAKEGLRTLVLGMRILTEQECTEWLAIYKSAAVSLSDRKALLTDAAVKIEKDLHIVGATAIEDKLQKKVPQTISTLGKAGIKLWVLTGDKRETAVEIGYSTHVLTSKMHLTEVPDNGKQHVRTQIAMEFIRLVKRGKLPMYQKAALEVHRGRTFRERMGRRLADVWFRVGKAWRSARRSRMRFMASIYKLLGMKKSAAERLEKVASLKYIEQKRIKGRKRRQVVRNKAEKTIQKWMAQREELGKPTEPAVADSSSEGLELTSEELPAVFNRASSARSIYNSITKSGRFSKVEMRHLSIAYLTAQDGGDGADSGGHPLVDEDTLSLDSFVPEFSGGFGFDKKKRTILERMFAVDRNVRKGTLKKHMASERLRQITEGTNEDPKLSSKSIGKTSDGPRALVIEGAALKHLLGDPEFEEIMFAVASNCEAVIACRVSPRQKALLVKLVRQNVRPEPVTLAIGDGANDVGMIQEAHVGIGISGREGRQAVNASDFSISQFRFLETLLLIHGRWDFFRLSTVVLFSFYKNAVMAGSIMVYASRTVFSGTPLYDEWVVSMLNFVAAFPIVFLGIFDRCLDKDYVRGHPEVYNPTRLNELITGRSLIRWILICISHTMILYFFCVPQQSYGGGITSAFDGLMKNNDSPGDGEGGGLYSAGTVTFSVLIVLLALKVLFESRALLHGHWPAITCRKGGEGFPSRLAYTWIGVTYLSIGFYFFAIGIYQLIGRNGAGTFSNFTNVTNHAFGQRSMSWMLLVFVPIMAMVLDVTFKVFSNMYYPTQTQIHVELEAMEKRERKGRAGEGSGCFRRRNRNEDAVVEP